MAGTAGRDGAPLQFDPALRVWVAADPALASALLAHPACRVCETSALVASLSSAGHAGANTLPAGALCDAERVVAALVESLTQQEVRDTARVWVHRLLSSHGTPGDDEALRHYARVLPGHVLGVLLGAQPDQLEHLAQQAGACRPAGDPAAPLGMAPSAAVELVTLMQGLVSLPAHGSRGQGLLGRLGDVVARRPALRAERTVDRLAQLFYLVHKASARLVLQSVRAWQAAAEVETWALHAASVPAMLVREVRRQAPPLQHAFRIWSHDATVDGQLLRTGDALVLQLEPPAPLRSMPLGLDRKKAKVLTFGAEPFGSAAQMLAETIAAEAVSGLLGAGVRFHGAGELHAPLRASG